MCLAAPMIFERDWTFHSDEDCITRVYIRSVPGRFGHDHQSPQFSICLKEFELGDLLQQEDQFQPERIQKVEDVTS
jgi:hypothetical protein